MPVTCHNKHEKGCTPTGIQPFIVKPRDISAHNPKAKKGGLCLNGQNLRWAVLGTGVIANEMAQALRKMGKRLYAVGNRTYEKAVAFAEKSVTLNSRELDEMIALAKEKNLILGEAMTIWHMPLYKELWRIVESGELGRVQMITVNFGSFKEYDMNNRFFNMNLAGGALLDIGVYALSLVRSFMSETPAEILSQRKPSPTGSDEQATILLKNNYGEMAAVALSMHSKQPKRAMISCEKGYIEITEFPRADKAVITDAESGEHRKLAAGDTANALCYELTDMEEAVRTGDDSLMMLSRTKDVMDIMTRLRKEWNLKYPMVCCSEYHIHYKLQY